jgi:hypothetical protein
MEVATWMIVLVSGSTRLEGRPGELLGRQDFEGLFLGAATRHGPAGDSEEVKDT